jgi:hypothetical protein
MFSALQNIIHENSISNRSKLVSFFVTFVIVLLLGCGNSPKPPLAVIAVRATFKTTQGKDLLNPSNPDTYKQENVKVTSKVSKNGSIIDINYNSETIIFYYDEELKSYCFDMNIPCNADKDPIESMVTLSPTNTDTITYTFVPSKYVYRENSNSEIPNKIFYNKVLVWQSSDIPKNARYQPMEIVK